jgi:pyruvate/2-oxoglutarate dehydrogenase complex dihydrolipoamide acyltransferase (E2) component
MDVLMPQLGETVAEGKISKWFVSAGDAVKPGDNLFEIETDKVSMEVPAITAGVLSAINVAAGETAPVGAVVATILGAGENASPSPPLTPAQQAQSAVLTKDQGVQGQAKKELDSRLRGNERNESQVSAPKAFTMEPFREVRSPERNFGPARLPGGTVVTPLARRLAGEAGIDLANVKGSGPHGRIVAADIETARKTPPAQTHATVPVVLTADVEIGRSLDLASQAKLSLGDVIVKAWATALKRVMPSEHSDIVLMTGKTRAVIRDAAGKSLTAIASARIDPGATDDTQGASSIFIVDVPGIASVVDVLRPPQTTMLSIGSQRRAPVEAAGGTVKFVGIVTATLSCDAHAVDGALGAELLAAFKGFVEQPVTMIV